MSFRENLKNELYYNDIQLKELAYRIKAPYTTLISYTKKNSLPNVEIGVKIAKELNVSVEFLVTGDDTFLKKEYCSIYPIIKELLNLPKSKLKIIEDMIKCFA